MKKKKLAIVGLGQIGGSILLSLRSNKRKYHITGIETSTKRLSLLNKHLDEKSRDWAAATEADFIVVCLHFRDTIDFLRQASSDALILDVCSAKTKVVDFARRRKLRFLGGHPLAGNEFKAEKGWDEHLFHGAPFFLCPTENSSTADLRFIRRFVQDLGALPILVSAAEHDRALAATSHFPAFLSLLLRQATSQMPDLFQGPGFRSMTRLSKTPPELLNTFLQSNRANIIHTARRFEQMLHRWILKQHKARN